MPIIELIQNNPRISIITLSFIVTIFITIVNFFMVDRTRMKEIKEKQKALRQEIKKFKDNPQKMNKEMMALYKEHKVNPLGGCFPMLLQMPVFIGLYQVLWRSVSFKGAGFLWIKDLSQPDRLSWPR